MKKIIILFMMILSSVSYSQTPITDANFQQAINNCLATNPVDGLCTNSEYGAMPDWDVSNVTDMQQAFFNKEDFNADISGWNVSNVSIMRAMFYGARSFNQNITGWNTANVTAMDLMFYGALDFSQPIGDWDTSSVINMGNMFYDAESFNQDISGWDVSSVISMYGMFEEASSFNQPLNDWDTSSVSDMNAMFALAFDFNQPLNDWDTSSVTNMDSMFFRASTFNQDISNWCVTNIASEPTQFSTDTPLSESNKPVWGTCPTASVDNQNQLDISIYPNPTSDIVYFDGNYSQLKVVVYDILGKQVIKESITNSVDISQLEKGVYILQLSDGTKLTTQRIIKN